MEDLIQRAIKKDLHLRVVAATTTTLVREACARHELSGAAAIVLGRALTAGCVMTTLTKRDGERLRVELRGRGPIGPVLVDARGDGSVRGCLIREVSAEVQGYQAKRTPGGRVSVGALVGPSGHIVVTRDVGLDNPYQGVVPLASGEIDEDLEQYLSSSEQLPSALGCEVVLDSAGQVVRAAGVLCQTFPDGDAEEVERLRDSLRSGSLHDLLLRDRSTDELVGFALSGQDFDSMSVRPAQFRCGCDLDTARSVLTTLGADDIESLAAERGGTEVRCSYCGANYEVSAEQLRALAAELRLARS